MVAFAEMALFIRFHANGGRRYMAHLYHHKVKPHGMHRPAMPSEADDGELTEGMLALI